MNYYWEGSSFSYLHYLSVKSFIDLNPDWTTRIYTPTHLSIAPPEWATPEQKATYTGYNYFPNLGELDVEIIPIDLDEYLGMETAHIHCVQRSDLFRWKLLAEEGGGWSDSDIIYTKPLFSLLNSQNGPALGSIKTRNLDDISEVVPFYTTHRMVNSESNIIDFKDPQIAEQLEGITSAKAPRLQCVTVCPIGFFLAAPDNTCFKSVLNKAMSPAFLDNVKDYQGVGIRVLEDLYSSMPEILSTNPGLVNIGHIPFYLYAWNQTALLFDEDNTHYKHPDVVGVHWYNGDAKAGKFKNWLNEATLQGDSSCTVHTLLKELQL